MYKGQKARLTIITNDDNVALANVVNEILTTKNVLDADYATLQKEPNVFVYVAFITTSE